MSEHENAAVPVPDLALPARPAGGLGGENVRREAAGCPTGLADSEQAIVTQQPGGAGAPGTGEPEDNRPVP